MASDVGRIAPILDAVAAWAVSRPDILAAALIGSWARGAATPASDIDLMILAAAPAALRAETWLDEIVWPADLGVTSWRDADYGVVWSRHAQLSDGNEIEFSFAARSWAATTPVEPSTLAIVRDGLQILVDKNGALRRLSDAAGRQT